jgi:sialate O-acetylesterase
MSAGGPFTLHIAGDGSIDIQDVMIGEVWLASGQSNMAFQLSRALNVDTEVAAATNPSIRFFKVGAMPQVDMQQPQSAVRGAWQPATPQAAAQFSAVAWFFAKKIQETLHVPVGVVQSAWGGTPVEAWSSKRVMTSNPELTTFFNSDLEKLASKDKVTDTFTKSLAAWETTNSDQDPGNTDLSFAKPGLDLADWSTTKLPATAKDLDIKGGSVVWFRKDVMIDPALIGKPLMLHFGRIAEESVCYVNGKRLGGYGGIGHPALGDVTFTVPANLLHEGTNTIALRVFAHTPRTAAFGENSIVFDGSGKQVIDGDWQYKIVYRATMLSAEAEKSFPTYSPVAEYRISTALYNTMIAPLGDYALRGALWYQGEQNFNKDAQYRVVLPMMIADWRAQWGNDFAFYIVQIPNLGSPQGQPDQKGIARLRYVQAETARTVPNSGLAVTIDVGDPKNIHPTNKLPVGNRLAALALARTYHLKVEDSGPVPGIPTVQKDSIIIPFTHTDGQLVSRGGDLEEFWIAGRDQKFYAAEAKLVGSAVVVKSPLISRPIAVRYAWSDNPEGANLYNAAGFPTAPFRTDDWPISYK